jgi:hypothetical protein
VAGGGDLGGPGSVGWWGGSAARSVRWRGAVGWGWRGWLGGAVRLAGWRGAGGRTGAAGRCVAGRRRHGRRPGWPRTWPWSVCVLGRPLDRCGRRPPRWPRRWQWGCDGHRGGRSSRPLRRSRGDRPRDVRGWSWRPPRADLRGRRGDPGPNSAGVEETARATSAGVPETAPGRRPLATGTRSRRCPRASRCPIRAGVPGPCGAWSAVPTNVAVGGPSWHRDPGAGPPGGSGQPVRRPVSDRLRVA